MCSGAQQHLAVGLLGDFRGMACALPSTDRCVVLSKERLEDGVSQAVGRHWNKDLKPPALAGRLVLCCGWQGGEPVRAGA